MDSQMHRIAQQSDLLVSLKASHASDVFMFVAVIPTCHEFESRVWAKSLVDDKQIDFVA